MEHNFLQLSLVKQQRNKSLLGTSIKFFMCKHMRKTLFMKQFHSEADHFICISLKTLLKSKMAKMAETGEGLITRYLGRVLEHDAYKLGHASFPLWMQTAVQRYVKEKG